MSKKAYGFTIIELLIVIIVIAILTAIGFVAYSGVRDRTYDMSVQSDLRNFAQKMELARLDQGTDSYPFGNLPEFNGGYNLTALTLNINRDAYAIAPTTITNLLVCRGGGEFGILATSKSGKRFYVTSTNGISEYTGTVSWATTSFAEICGSVNPVLTQEGGAGYRSSGQAPFGWRPWASS